MSNNRILPIFGGGGPSPSNYYTKAEIDAMLQNYAQLATTDLANYYLKTETYTQQEIQNLIGQITSFEVVATLPVSDIKTNVIYLLGPTGTGADKYEEWIYSNSAWVKIGETSVDLSNYVTVNQLNTALGFYTTTLDLNTLLAGKQDVLTAGANITIGTDNVISATVNTEEIEHAIAAAINDTRDRIDQDLHNNYVQTQTMNDQLKNYAPKAALDAYSSKSYVDTAIGSVYAEIEDKERATSFALNDLHTAMDNTVALTFTLDGIGTVTYNVVINE